MTALLAKVGGFGARRKWWVLTAWILILVVAVLGAVKFSRPTDPNVQISGLPSITTLDRIDADFATADEGSGNGKVVFAAPGPFTATDRQAVAALEAALKGVPGVTGVADPVTRGRIGYLAVSFRGKTAATTTQDGVAAAMAGARGTPLQVEATETLAPPKQQSSNQLIGILLAFVVLAVTFGSLLAAGLPLLTALLGLGIGVGSIYAATSFIDLNATAPTLAILLSLAVGIDYTLFIVNRHRQQVLDGMDVRASIPEAMRSAGAAVFFAAATVVVALAGLAVVGIGFLTQMGLAAAFGVVVAMLIALTLTPALLALMGRRVVSRRTRRRHADRHRHLARGWATTVSRHPVVFGLASLVVLGALAIPATTMRLGLPNAGDDPGTSTDRRAYDLMAEGFGPGVNGPILVLVTQSTGDDSVRLKGVDGVAAVIPSGAHGAEALYTVIPRTGPSDEATQSLVKRLRQVDPTFEVSGSTAVAIDISARLAGALPVYLGLIALFAFVILLVAFRSVLVPLKATLSFLLSLGATLGCVVAVFQWGWLGNLFQVDPPAPLLSFLPILIIGVLFGLSMDYEMFLVSGMRDRHLAGDPARDAVVGGFARSAKVVVAAALIMIGVFGNGVFAGSGTIRPIAFGLAVGVLVDAFVVRLTLVPAVMTLLGESAWWFPGRRKASVEEPARIEVEVEAVRSTVGS
jgi:RND superfamily putative drug exporter